MRAVSKQGSSTVIHFMANLLLNGDIVSNSPEFTLEANPLWVIRTRASRVKWRTTLGIGIMMVVLKLTDEWMF